MWVGARVWVKLGGGVHVCLEEASSVHTRCVCVASQAVLETRPDPSADAPWPCPHTQYSHTVPLSAPCQAHHPTLCSKHVGLQLVSAGCCAGAVLCWGWAGLARHLCTACCRRWLRLCGGLLACCHVDTSVSKQKFNDCYTCRTPLWHSLHNLHPTPTLCW